MSICLSNNAPGTIHLDVSRPDQSLPSVGRLFWITRRQGFREIFGTGLTRSSEANGASLSDFFIFLFFFYNFFIFSLSSLLLSPRPSFLLVPPSSSSLLPPHPSSPRPALSKSFTIRKIPFFIDFDKRGLTNALWDRDRSNRDKTSFTI